MAIVVSLCQRKGGSSKTTLAVSLAAVAASVASSRKPRGPLPRGNGPILVDCDSQSNASRWCMGRPTDELFALEQTVARLAFPPRVDDLPPGSPLRAAKTIPELLELVLPKCLHDVPDVPGLRLVPSSPRVHPENVKEIVLRDLPADFVIVDTGADTSTPIARSVIGQSDFVIVPTICEPWGIDGIREVLSEIRSTGRLDLLDSRALRIVVSKRERTRTQDAFETAIRDELGDLVSDVVVPKSAAIALASGGPRTMPEKHVLRTVASSLWKDVLRTLSKKEAAA